MSRLAQDGLQLGARSAARKTAAVLFGLLLALALLKFGNPFIAEEYLDPPHGSLEWLYFVWPLSWGYWLLGLIAVPTLLLARKPSIVLWPAIALSAVWMAWQFLAAAHTIDTGLTGWTLLHFASCMACFYIGALVVSQFGLLNQVWVGLTAGFLIVLFVGFEQHFGGLEETRRYFYLYTFPQKKDWSQAYLQRMESHRIFSTLFYANSLAEVILLLLPPTLAFFWSLERQFTAGARVFLVGAIGLGGVACLIWSGSKGGSLLMLAVMLVAFLYLPWKRERKIALVAGVLILGCAGFAWKYAGYFKRGATSVVARFDYWQAALKTVASHPFVGSGPGTFGKAYQRIKRPESEMAKMTHNDYLEQASDSGVIGFLAFSGFVVSILTLRRPRLGSSPQTTAGPNSPFGQDARPARATAHRQKPHTTKQNALNVRDGVSLTFPTPAGWFQLGVWLGLLGWALQSFVEFGLYIPAIAWPAFCMMGWLAAQPSNRIDINPTAAHR